MATLNLSQGLSVVIPVANMSGKLHFLEAMINDAMRHSIKLIIVHDKHDDATSDELSELIYSRQNGHVTFLEGKFGNPGETRNHGLLFCETDWVTFWDSDDQVYVENYIDMLNETILSDAKLGIGLIGVSKEKHYARSDKIESDSSLILQIANFPGFTRMIYHKSILKENIFPDLRFGEDLVFLAALNVKFTDSHIYNHEVYRYFVGNEYQATSSKPTPEQITKLLGLLISLFKAPATINQQFVVALIVKIVLSRSKNREIFFDIASNPKLFTKILIIFLKNPSFVFGAIRYFLLNRPKVVSVIHAE